jgi:hypothetical protein
MPSKQPGNDLHLQSTQALRNDKFFGMLGACYAKRD